MAVRDGSALWKGHSAADKEAQRSAVAKRVRLADIRAVRDVALRYRAAKEAMTVTRATTAGQLRTELAAMANKSENQRVGYLQKQIRYYTHGVQDGFPKVAWSKKGCEFTGSEADLTGQLQCMIAKAATAELPTEPPLVPAVSSAGLKLGPSEGGATEDQQSGNLLLCSQCQRRCQGLRALAAAPSAQCKPVDVTGCFLRLIVMPQLHSRS